MQNKVITMQNVLKEFAVIYGYRPDKEVISLFYEFYPVFINSQARSKYREWLLKEAN